MAISYPILNQSDVNDVDALMKQNSSTLGFLPKSALIDFLDRETVIGSRDVDGSLVGYLLYASYPERIRIVHLCVAKGHQRTGIARSLLERLKKKCDSQCVIRLNCRNDYEADKFWPLLGFVPVDEKTGRSAQGLPLTCWELRLKDAPQLDIFKEKMSDETLDVVIDAQILFHFNEAPSPESIPSQALLADFLADQIRINVTDEIFNEIRRHKRPETKRASRSLANLYQQVNYDPESAERYVEGLKSIIRSRTDSAISDIQHLAQTAASSVDVFVTRDQGILRRSREIADLVDLEVLSPERLIVRLHELSSPDSYRTFPVSGQSLALKRATNDILDELLETLVRAGEPKRKTRRLLQRLLSVPNDCSVDILWHEEEVLGVKAWTAENKRLTVSYVRTAKSKIGRQLEEFLIWDSVATCPTRQMRVVELKEDALPEGSANYLPKMGFQRFGSHWYRLPLAAVITRSEAEDELRKYVPDATQRHHEDDHEILQRCCSPVVLKDRPEPAFLIPIKPNFAMSLFNRQTAARDLFGGKAEALMRWENVYFRRKTHHHMLKAPARLLWYESGSTKAITAASLLDLVDIASARDLFHKYQKFGALDWKEVSEMCKGNPSNEIMVLKFSDTFIFPTKVLLSDLRDFEQRTSVPVQSPRTVENSVFHKIMIRAFGGLK